MPLQAARPRTAATLLRPASARPSPRTGVAATAAPTPQPAPADNGPGTAPAREPAPDSLTFRPAVISFPDRETATATQLSPSQLAFLARKSAYLAGTGPLFPPESTCPACGGLGSHVCKGCGGQCVNPEGFVPPRGLVLEDARQFNGRVDVTTFLMPGGLCFYCSGKGTGACVACEGTGFAGGRMEMFTGD